MSDQRLFWFINIGVIVLVGLVLALVLGLGRIAISIFRDRQEARKPKKSIVVDGVGTLTFDARSLLWFGEVENVSIGIAGDVEGPDVRLTEAYREIQKNLPMLQGEALRFILEGEDAKSVGAKSESYSLCGIDLLRTEKPDCFGLEFSLEGDVDGVWRVEFEDGRAVFTGRDD